MTAIETKQRILDAAENLFAGQGFDATSLRAITAEAAVNLASVNYHFGTKDALIAAVLARRLEPLNSERLSLLGQARGQGEALGVERILECFYGPALRMASAPDTGTRRFMQLFGRTFTEPGDTFREIFAEQFREVIGRFGAALHEALPHLSRTELAWRMHFLVGALAHTVASPHALRVLHGGDPIRLDSDEALARLVRFAAAGLAAPAVDPVKESKS